MKAHRYAREPFSGDGWKRASIPAKPLCGICGRVVKGGTFEDGWTLWGVVVDGGASWGDEHSDESDPGYMGWFPIGKDCHALYCVKPLADGWTRIGHGVRVHAANGEIDRVYLDETLQRHLREPHADSWKLTIRDHVRAVTGCAIDVERCQWVIERFTDEDEESET
jgi:hypothetical protein